MDLIPYLSAVIMVSTVATVLLAVLSYAAFKLRDKRKPKRNADEQPVFFHRYMPPEEGSVSPGRGDCGGVPAEP
ncbi:MAG: hypothetical protein GY733_22835 [bacterium]|nr:hypothetical protein [bacterium]